MHKALSLQPLTDAGSGQQVDRALLQHAGADPALDIGPAVALQNDRFDAGIVQ